jgi:MYXO-CTERM domain-containing protein
VSDGSEDVNGNGVVDGDETDPTTGHGDDDDDPQNTDTDGDGLTDAFENEIGTDPLDQDSDDDGLIDGQEPNPADDTDGDGLINAEDPDSDNDGLFDGTELGQGCTNPDTDVAAETCIPDGDMGATKTSPVDADSDDGGVIDGDEDKNHNGVLDAGETDPTSGHGADDKEMTGCTQDSECGGPTSGQVCNEATQKCEPGCRGVGGNGCGEGETCSSTDSTIGVCAPAPDKPGGGYSPWGGGIFCSASPARDQSSDLAWIAGLGVAAALTIRRRRRLSR